MRKILFTLALTTLMLAGAGCQSVRDLEQPDVTLSTIRLQQMSVFEQEWQAELSAFNPNDRDITLRSLDYDIYVNGERLARGREDGAIALAAREDTTFTTTLSTSLMSTLRQLQSLAEQGDEPLRYELKGSARIVGVALPVEFDHEGEFTLK